MLVGCARALSQVISADAIVQCIFGEAAQARPHPEDRKTLIGLKAYVYDIPEAFHRKTLDALRSQGTRQSSSCDFGVSPCTDENWSPRYTTKRMYAAEVVILQKLLRAINITADPKQADLFVVPWLVRSHCALREHWQRCRGSFISGRIWRFLPHYNATTRGRHLFFATGGPCDTPVDVQSQALVVTLGPIYVPTSLPALTPGHIIVPYLNAEPMLQPCQWNEPSVKTTWALLAFSTSNRLRVMLREQFINAISSNASGVGRVQVFDFARKVYLHRSLSAARPSGRKRGTTPRRLLEAMRDSRFCIVPPGDTPKSKRFFDAILTLCVPVVVAFSTSLGSGSSWWAPHAAPLEWSLPFAEKSAGITNVNYTEAVVILPVSAILAGKAVDYLREVSASVYEARVAYLRLIRTYLLYDYAGTKRDAFSLAMERLALLVPLARTAKVACMLSPKVGENIQYLGSNYTGSSHLQEVNRRAWGERQCYFHNAVEGAIALLQDAPPQGNLPHLRSSLPSFAIKPDHRLQCYPRKFWQNMGHALPVVGLCNLSSTGKFRERAKELVTFASCTNLSVGGIEIAQWMEHLSPASGGNWNVIAYDICPASASVHREASYIFLAHILSQYYDGRGMVQFLLQEGISQAIHTRDEVRFGLLDVLEDRVSDGVAGHGFGAGHAFILDAEGTSEHAWASCWLFQAIFSSRCPTPKSSSRLLHPISVVTTWEAVRHVPRHRWENAFLLSAGRARCGGDVLGVVGALLHEAGVKGVSGADPELEQGYVQDMDFEDAG